MTRTLAHIALLLAGCALAAGAAQAQVKVLMSGGFSSAYQQVLPEFEKSTGITVLTGSGASQGTGPLTIAAQLQRGVAADVVILSREGLAELIAAGRIVPGSDADLARVPLGVSVRSGSPLPDVGTVEAFKRALLSAKTIAVPASTSGIFLTKTVFPQLGISERITATMKERGAQSAAMVAQGEANIVVQPVSELLHVPGLTYAGRVPDELQLLQVFAAAIVVGSKEPEAAQRLIAFLHSERAAAAMERNGMELLRSLPGD